MKNIVTFETAKRLKEAGFPQPEPEVESIWYEESGDSYIISYVKGELFYGCYFGDNSPIEGCSVYEIAGDIFAPTATDILAEMTGALITFEVYVSVSEFEVWRFGKLLASSDNPAEAAAGAWLALHEE